jgi:hypothetical protein
VDTFVFWGEDFPTKIHTTQTTQMAIRSASAVDGVCVGLVINAVTVAVSIVVAVFVTIAIANRHFFQEPFS